MNKDDAEAVRVAFYSTLDRVRVAALHLSRIPGAEEREARFNAGVTAGILNSIIATYTVEQQPPEPEPKDHYSVEEVLGKRCLRSRQNYIGEMHVHEASPASAYLLVSRPDDPERSRYWVETLPCLADIGDILGPIEPSP